jgi:hypothetical protein
VRTAFQHTEQRRQRLGVHSALGRCGSATFGSARLHERVRRGLRWRWRERRISVQVVQVRGRGRGLTGSEWGWWRSVEGETRECR